MSSNYPPRFANLEGAETVIAEKVELLGISRGQDHMYYVKDGGVWRIQRKQRGVPKGDPQKVVDGTFEMDTDYIYFVDEDGDVSRVTRPEASLRTTKRKSKATSDPSSIKMDEHDGATARAKGKDPGVARNDNGETNWVRPDHAVVDALNAVPAIDDHVEEPGARRPFAPYGVHITLARSLFEQAVSDGVLTLADPTAWASVTRLVDEAHARRQLVAIVVSDSAPDASNLLGWGLLERVSTDVSGTSIRVTELQRLTGRKTQCLLLRETGQALSRRATLPYDLVHTPAFLGMDRESLLTSGDSAEAPTLFSFGYEGCGMGTARFVAAVDKIERARGFEPPLWIDARISRSVRAEGFRDKALERLVGAERYRWMSDLGNEGILDGGEMRIRRPEAVADLLRLALGTPRRRVIFFCSCSGSFAFCHRHEVGRLLLEHSRKVEARVRLVEWPGGEPVTMVFDVSSTSELRRKTLDTDGVLGEEEAAAVPWGSHGILRAEGHSAEHVLLGPALFGENQTVLRIAEHLGPVLPVDPMSIAHLWRTAHVIEAMTPGADGV